ncbi:MAG: 16S rRNA (cytidine(1402)-2'-O)-methyltransferase [Patescibacteria group bacterium]|jgi:16S rRNA (cytidine1402-2'-O)-methyltransferase
MDIADQKFGTLYIVATPIGNMGDITLRAIETLKSVDLIACEDTRVSKKLLDHLGIQKKMISLHQHSGEDKFNLILRALTRGVNVAYITDGGTPGISDPGQELAKNLKLKTNNLVKVIPIPGPSAVVAAISVSGMVEKEFYFVGFLPKKKGRQTTFKFFESLNCPIVIYESAIRLQKTLEDVKNYLGGDTEVFIAREMTKMFEEYWGGNIEHVISELKNHTLKGEIVLIVRKSVKSVKSIKSNDN